jgi:copper chaperone NosL
MSAHGRSEALMPERTRAQGRPVRRRAVLACSALLTPVAGVLLVACADDAGNWPDGMLPIKWDRDTCTRCAMVISDRRFAAEVRGGPQRSAFKFDDIGCAVTWCAEKIKQHPWLAEPATRLWVADFAAKGERWLDATQAHYAPGPRSPMGYDLAAHAQAVAGSADFPTMARQAAATWPANCLPGKHAQLTTLLRAEGQS